MTAQSSGIELRLGWGWPSGGADPPSSAGRAVPAAALAAERMNPLTRRTG
ncbi:hypothetical protein [Streptomyces chartreusis]